MNVSIIKKVGRPTKPQQAKKETKRKHNENYYLSTTKVLQIIAKNYELNQKKLNTKDYRNGLVNFFNQFQFNNFFTGTINPNHIQREKLDILNKRIKQINKELDVSLSYEVHKPKTLNQLIRLTNNYVNYLYSKKVIDRVLIFFEQNKAKEWHTHILMNVIESTEYVDFEMSWLNGISLLEPITNKKSIIEYSVKQLNIRHDKKGFKNLNWNLKGDYNMKTELTKEQKLAMLKAYKINNNLNVKIDHEHQKYLQQKYIRISA